MQDNVLKKEFSPQDVQRVRNLVQGKYGEKVTEGVGYTKKEEIRQEGDIWESDGRKWTIKDGIRQNITKLDKAKKAHLMPIFCPNCNTQMKKRFDKDYYNIHKKCFECVIDFEHELKKTGKWEEYERNIKNNELDNRVKEFKLWIQDKLQESNNSFISEDGEMEKWVGKIDKDKVMQYVSEVEEYLTSLKK